jgi:hypothetical protein
MVFGGRPTAEVRAAIANVRATFDKSIVVGASTSGHFLGTRLHDDVTVAIAAFEHTALTQASVILNDARCSAQAGRDLGRQLLAAGSNLQSALILSDGTFVNGTALLEGIKEVLPADVSLFGGLAGDGGEFESTSDDSNLCR